MTTIPGATLYVVDGTFELFRCFHGAPRAKDRDGNEGGALKRLMWTLVKLLRREDLTHAVLAYEDLLQSVRGNRRCQIRGATRLSENLRNRKDETLLTRALSVLRTDMPLPQSADALE